MGWEMFDLAANHAPRDEYTDATMRFLKAMQTAEGKWRSPESRRPPMGAGEFQAAALAIFALKSYGPPAEQADTERVIARAAAWLAATKAERMQDAAFQLMGLGWAGAKPEAIAASTKALITLQRADGGWAQLPAMDSDAYATGQALYALNAGGKIPSSDPPYVRGLKYLLRTQAADGSWHVNSRSIWIQPYFESGFPYGHDQWISAAGTSWAVMALAMTQQPQQVSENRPVR